MNWTKSLYSEKSHICRQIIALQDSKCYAAATAAKSLQSCAWVHPNINTGSPAFWNSLNL